MWKGQQFHVIGYSCQKLVSQSHRVVFDVVLTKISKLSLCKGNEERKLCEIRSTFYFIFRCYYEIRGDGEIEGKMKICYQKIVTY